MPLLGLVVVLTLAGCSASSVQGTKYTAFKTATVALAQDAQTSYTGVEGLWEDLTAQCLAMPGNSVDYGFILRGEGNPCGKDTFKNPKEQLDVRLKAMNVLVGYATMLNTLATTDYAAGVDASAAKLTASLQSLQTSLNTTFKTEVDLQNASTLLGTVVQSAGGLYVNGKRKEALRRILSQSQESIKTLSHNLVLDNGEVSSLAESQTKYLVLLAEKKRPKEFESRLSYDRKIWQRHVSALGLIASLQAMDKAIARLPEAHAELLASLDAPQEPMLRLEAFLAAVEQALLVAQQIKNF